MALFGKESAFKLLERAEKEDKKIELIQDLTVDGGPGGLRLV